MVSFWIIIARFTSCTRFARVDETPDIRIALFPTDPENAIISDTVATKLTPKVSKSVRKPLGARDANSPLSTPQVWIIFTYFIAHVIIYISFVLITTVVVEIIVYQQIYGELNNDSSCSPPHFRSKLF